MYATQTARDATMKPHSGAGCENAAKPWFVQYDLHAQNETKCNFSGNMALDARQAPAYIHRAYAISSVFITELRALLYHGLLRDPAVRPGLCGRSHG